MSSINSVDKHDNNLLISDVPITVHDYIVEERPWYKVPHLRLLAWCVFVLTLTSTNNGYDGSMLNGLQSLDIWQEDLGHPAGQKLGALANGVLFGNLAAVPFASIFCDRFGRRPLIFVGQISAIVGSILQGVSTSYGFFLGARIVLGFGVMLATIPSPTLISEIAYPTHRETSTFAYNVCWYLGAIIASWVTYGTRNIQGRACWSIPSFLQAAIPFFQVCCIWFLPESPRFLISKGKIDQARAVLSKYHTGNSTDPRDIALVEFELTEIQTALEQEKTTSSSYWDFIKKKNFRKRAFLCAVVGVAMQLSGNGLVSYYLSKVLDSIGITETKKQLEINGCLMIYNFVICFMLMSVCRIFKRRTLFLTCFSGMLLCYTIWTILSALNEQRHYADKGLANGVLAMIFFYYFFYNVGINGLPFLYITEILPYSHRAKGLNLFQTAQFFTQVYNGYVNPIAMDAISWKYYIVYCCIIFVELAIVFFTFPETSGYTLEEVAQVFGDEAPGLEHRTLEVDKHSVEHIEHV